MSVRRLRKSVRTRGLEIRMLRLSRCVARVGRVEPHIAGRVEPHIAGRVEPHIAGRVEPHIAGRVEPGALGLRTV